MFNRKDTEEIKEALADLSQEIKEVRSEQKELHETNNKLIKNISSSLEELKQGQTSHSELMGKEVSKINELRSEFSKSVRSFELLHKKIYGQLYTRLHEVLREHTNDLKSTTDNYKATSPKVKETLDTLDLLKSEIAKFNAIAKYIKESDYTLVNHQKDLERLDREKLHLMKKVDSLQRMIGKNRRNSY